MSVLHPSGGSFPFKYSGSKSSTSNEPPRKTGFDRIQSPSPRTNLAQAIRVYLYGTWNWADSSRVICRSSVSIGLGPVLSSRPPSRPIISNNDYEKVSDLIQLVIPSVMPLRLYWRAFLRSIGDRNSCSKDALPFREWFSEALIRRENSNPTSGKNGPDDITPF